MEIVNVIKHVEPETEPLCPICDQPIFEYDEVKIGVSSGVKFLVHSICTE